MTDATRDDLDAYMAGEPDWTVNIDTDPREVEIEGLVMADQFLRRLRRLAADEADVREVARQEFERIQAWQEDRLAGIERYRAWIEAALEGFMRAYHRERRTKTVKLANGTLALSKRPERIVVVNAEAAIKWADEEHPEWVKREETPKAGDMKKGVAAGRKLDADDVAAMPPEPQGYEYHEAVVKDTGQIVPGVFILVGVTDAMKAKPAEPGHDDEEHEE